ncbi:transporter substrate-binding domain-containing protein [Pseudoclavibacter sp. CFCC 11306]|nr:transporter substrate-binding domain-containing protein [Pseudoclavibacter sp. CFCC 11306]
MESIRMSENMRAGRKRWSKTRWTVSAAACLAVVSAAALTGCSSDSGSTVAEGCTPAHDGLTTTTSGKLSVAVVDAPPYSSNVTGGGAEGLEVEILKKLAEVECLDIAYSASSFAGAVPLITQQKSVDIAAGAFYPTAKRNEVADFVGPLYYDNMSIATRSGAKKVSDLESLGSIGTVDGFLWTDDLRTVLGDKIRTYASSTELSQDMLNGRLDAAVDSVATSQLYYKDQSDISVEVAEPDPRVAVTENTPQVIFPVSKDNAALRDALIADVAKMRDDGTMADLIKSSGFDASANIPATDSTLRIIS